MEKVFVLITELHNQTDQVIEFEVENGYFRIGALPPNKKGYVELWKVLKAKHDCPKWKIRFMMNKEFSGLEINANQLLYYARIIIKLERVREGLYLPYLEAIPEKRYADYWLRLKYLGCNRDKYWDKRPSFRMPYPKWVKTLRVVEAQSRSELVVQPVANQNLLQRVLEAQSRPELVVQPVANQNLLQRVLEAQSRAELVVQPVAIQNLLQRVLEAQSRPELVVQQVANQNLLQSCRSIKKPATEEESDGRITNASPPLGASPPEGPAPEPELEPEPAASLRLPQRENMVTQLHMNDERRIVSSLSAAALQPEELRGPPNRRTIRRSRRPDEGGSVENIEGGLGGNMMEQQPHQEEDDALRMRCKDMENTVHLMLFVIAFICVLYFKFLV